MKNLDEIRARPFSKVMFDYHDAERDFKGALCDADFGEFHTISGDYYDNSLEIHRVHDDARLNEAAQRVIFDAGFSKAYVNHRDGWETHYNWDQRKPFAVDGGWRRKKREDGFDISEWPEGWGDPKTGPHAGWLKSGYMRIVRALPRGPRETETTK